MKIMVCIKQVPGTSQVKVDPVTGVLLRDGVESKMNPYDLFALETALTLRDTYGGSVQVITMGPPAAREVLMEAIYMGADSGILVSDRKFAGADVLATGRTLSSAIRAAGDFDLILCGKQTTDGDTAQVGAEKAEFLELPHFSNVHSLSAEEDGALTVTCELGHTVQTARVALPCLCCMDGDINTPRLPSYRRKCQTRDREELIRVISLCDFADQNPEHYGLSGSPTQVERIFPPEKNSGREFLTGDGQAVCGKIFSVLKTEKFI